MALVVSVKRIRVEQQQQDPMHFRHKREVSISDERCDLNLELQAGTLLAIHFI